MKLQTGTAEHVILLTNDDGITSPGLLALRTALRELGRTEIFAPDRNWSAASRTRTFHKPLRVDPVPMLDGSVGRATSGTPSDCVSLALLGLLDARPDLIVSGINAGLNLGRDVSYSGTVAAAMEGARSGIPAIAVSYDTLQAPSDDLDYSRAADFVRRLVRFLFARPPLPSGILLNVNVPHVPAGRTLRARLTRLGGEAYSNYLVTGKDPHGREYYWITGDPLTGGTAGEGGTDLDAIAEGFVSITPIHLDMTEYGLLTELRPWEDESDLAS